MPEKTSPHYHAFLLRMWREEGQLDWRLTLENPHNQQRHGFTSMEQLISFLRELALSADEPTADAL